MLVIIDNYDSFTYNLYQSALQFTDSVEVIRNDALTLGEFSQLDVSALILSPGSGWPKDAGLCPDLVFHFAQKIPILGVCLGHQVIVEVFGGKITYAPEIIHGKSCSVHHQDGKIFRGVSLPFEAARYHSLVADPQSIPDCLSIEAKTTTGEIMAVAHKHYLTWGIQFHPESILTPEGDKIMRNFLS